MTTIVRSVSLTQDDACEIPADCNTVRTQRVGDASGDVGCGQIFVVMLIPRRSTIDSATLRWWARLTYSGGGTVDGDILAEQVASAVTYTDSPPCDVLARIATAIAADAVVVNWPDLEVGWTAGAIFDSPEIKAIIQQVVDQLVWDGNANIGLLVHDDGTSTDFVEATSLEFEVPPAALAPQLTVDFTEPPPRPVRFRGRDDSERRFRGRQN